jgi:hypothetical protein
MDNKIVLSLIVLSLIVISLIVIVYFVSIKENFDRNLISDEILKGNVLNFYDNKPESLQKASFNLSSW